MTASIEDLEEHAEARRLSLAEAMAQYDVVSASPDPKNPYLILADRAVDTSLTELGYASPSPWTAWTRDERVPELRGKQGLRVYYDMKRSDSTIRSMLRAIKTAAMSGRWFMEPASDSSLDKNISDFVGKNFFEDLSVPWSRIVEDALLMCDYGFMPFEIVWNPVLDNGKLKIQKLAPRHPMDVKHWLWDDNGGVRGVVMEERYGPNTHLASTAVGASLDFQGMNNYIPPTPIPIEKMVIFVLEQEAGDLRGISLLRSAYKHWYYKDTLYKIDAIQKERHGIGIPTIKLPLGWTAEDRKLADDLGRNLRTNEKAHVALPMNWEFMFAKLEGQPVDCIVSIEHHDMKIKSNILAPFLDEPSVGGSQGLDIFFKSARYVATTVCDTINHFVIPKMVDANFQRGGYPKLRVRRIGEQEDIRTMSFSFRNFVGAGAIQPDDKLEEFLRKELDLPPLDKETVRVVPTPQIAVGAGSQEALAGQGGADPGAPSSPAPPKVGPPRQSTSASMGTGKKNTGRDTSGGK